MQGAVEKYHVISQLIQFPCTPRETVLLVNAGHDAEHHGPDEGRKHSARYRITSNTSIEHATATVLLVHTGQNAEHSGPANQRREHSARSNVTIKTSLVRPLQRSFRSIPAMMQGISGLTTTPREEEVLGSFSFLLFFLFFLAPLFRRR